MRLLFTERKLLVGLGALVGVLVVNFIIGGVLTRELFENSRWVAHTHEVLEELERVNGTLTDAESGQRGYLLTGAPASLESYDRALPRLREALDRVERLTSDNSAQSDRIPPLKELVEARLALLAENIERYRAEGADAPRDGMQDGRGMNLMNEARSRIEEMRAHEVELLETRSSANDSAYQAALVSGLIAFLCALTSLAAFLWILNEHLRVRARAAAEIHEQRELLQATLASIGDGVIATDSSGRVTFLNPVAQRLTGWTQSEAEGRPLDEVFRIVNEQSRGPVENPAVHAVREGRVTGLANHTILLSREGVEWPIDDSAAPIRSAQGTVSGAILVFREISERKRQEASLREHSDALKIADRRKDEFLATLAHELRNPLSPISNALQIWPLVENDRAEMERLREMMDRQVRQMTRLVDDLLDVSRITRGKIQLRTELVDLRTLVSAAIEGLQPLIDSSGHRVAMELPPTPLPVEGDPARLTQVFGNILHNAAKYTGRNGEIRIAVRQEERTAVVSIRDNGPGIPPHMLAEIFEMFQQVDRTLDRSHGGLGIGLTLVRRLVQLHAGSVEARSDGQGSGTEFVVRLPLVSDRSYEAPGAALASRREVPRLRVLVVDDAKASASTLAMMLRSIGQDVSTAHDGLAAIAWAAEHRPDVIFLDIAMPGMDGYEVARRIRGDDRLREIFLVALTGFGQDEDRRRAIEAGFNHHLTKPTSIDALIELLSAKPDRTQSVGGQAAARGPR